MSHTYRSRTRSSRTATCPAADYAALLEIAEVLDLVATCRAELYATAAASAADDADVDADGAAAAAAANAAADEGALRIALFALLDEPTQATWEKVREVEVLPAFLPGLSTPSPLGLTLGDIVYAAGLPDLACPSRAGLLRALRRVAGGQGASPITG
ncbi:hypothetical protein Xcel_3199 [Xylanimonas cellulosilytica DSM 15894]|uniref:Uncharacterized protein n=1 Tax=Xylanimonas cellulosilytica (strain DSM 15894 / JCM 12276 / CECT 5975 / KCTC 9989 / LMG 20990 / NBRC 107835 / XIL07) TaxID=446471 RepID=D1C0J6_XYLCX|nr:hypothetical protein [Xylanimonas cellulosilytica]ACZ32199.1 hypothetical protein Xcel_3199 [Xylanimonas cellulosilytica DSM 15894]